MKQKLFFIFALIAMAMNTMAQEIRYVKTDGDNSKNGQSWTNAKKDIQDAINDLVNNNMTGEVWVKGSNDPEHPAVYYPTETTESSGSPYYKSFKIPAGITVRGGFAGNETTAADRITVDDKNFGNGNDDGGTAQEGNLDSEDAKSGVYKFKTILCGDLVPNKPATFTWNAIKQQFDVAFYGNSYHVVWFAMNGFSASGRANPLAKPAKLEGCVVEGGHAFTRDAIAEHPHIGYGGGIYMVANSFVYNCEVRNCDASRNGGGIYMDGGGIVRRTYVHDCQALGVGAEFGLGGGICENGSATNSKSNPIVVAQSVVTNCVGRMGGGMALLADKTIGKNKYAVVVNSSLVNNNTAQIEAGGVYTQNGGGLAAVTVVRNKCNGSGITQNGLITGRSGGVYSRNASYIGNCVFWGNECEANKNIQYADSRSSLQDTEKTHFFYNALSNADIADWSKSEKMGVLSLDDKNTTDVENKGNKGYPLFENPTPTAGYLANIESASPAYNWKVFSESALHHAGINTADLDYESLTPAPQGTSYDMQFGVFNARCTMGAIVSEEPTIAPQVVGEEVHFFVDPNYNFAMHHDQDTKGASWDLPTRFLGNVLEYIQTNASTSLNGKHIYIHVKEGEVDNTDSYKSGRVRNIALDIPSNVTLLGSYDKSLTGTNLTLRNVVHTPTVISGKLFDEYRYNLAHLINISDKKNVLVEGFKIAYANASSTELANTNKDGAAITISNSTEIKFRNILVSNCTADHGAAVYATNNSQVDFENCVFHNNESKTIDNSGIVYATNGSKLQFDHCDVLRNVGYASYLGTNNATNNTTNYWKNSIFYGNLSKPVNDTNIGSDDSDPDHSGLNKLALPAFSGNTAQAAGAYCMFDAKSASFASQFGGGDVKNGGDTGNQWQYNLQYAFDEGTGQGYPRFINPTKNCGVTEDGDATYYGRATSFEPHNNNPIVNMASANGAHDTWGMDIVNVTRDFGGLPDIGAVENHEAKTGVNAYKDGQKAYGGVLYVRDYRNNDGTIDQSIVNRDGTSWERAINGNATYTLSGDHKYKATTTGSETVFKGFRIYNGDKYLAVSNGTLNRIDVSTSGDPYNPGTDDPEAWQPIENAGIFVLCDADGKPLGKDANKTSAKYIKESSTGQFLYLDYMYGNYAFRTSVNPPTGQAEVIIASSNGAYTIKFTANNKERYLCNAAEMPSTTATAWTFSDPIEESHDYKTGDVATQSYNMGTFTGLQYAVNLANIMFNDDLLSGKETHESKKQVWVGAGVYQRDPAKNTDTTPSTPIVEMDEENCFIIQDGVDVYGAFPKAGNPGMNEREALVSQYVHVQAERGCSPADYETILEPKTQGVASNVKRRVLGQPYKYNPDKGNDTKRGTNGGILYCGTDYVGIVWDGFTIRNGVWDSQGLNRPNRYGGAGAAIYRNVTLKNVIVYNNTTIYTNAGASQDFRAGGIYMDGGTLDAGYVINNRMSAFKSSNYDTANGAAYGGGMYIYTGTVYNSVIANNLITTKYADGAGVFIENSNFFNNTIVNNKAEGVTRASGGVAIWTDPGRGTDSKLTLYNCIIAQNEGYKGESNSFGNYNVCVPREGLIELHNCLTTETTKMVKNKSWIDFINCGEPIKDYTNIFVSKGQYGDVPSTFDLRLKSEAARAINAGDDAPVIGGAVYNLVDYNDMDFAERIQDCRIDIGAYEFNGATNITPQLFKNGSVATTDNDKATADQAIYYVTPNGYGTTNASDPENAACAQKLQRVLDAAGRYKYLNPEKQVIVKVANSYDMLHPANSDDPTNFTYYATRTTDWTDQDVRVWSIIVPRGVEVWGGYTDVAVDESLVKTNTPWSNSNNGFQIRNITKNPTYFDSYYVNKLEKTDAHTYHVVTFSDRIYDLNGYAYTKADFKNKSNDEIRTMLQKGTASAYVELIGNDEEIFAHMSEGMGGLSGIKGNVIMNGKSPKNFGTPENPQYASNRAVIDGIFVSGGQANASSNNSNTANINQYGGAALVNDYAYVRNCILTGNTAINGGALALTDHALVSGCLIMENEATNKGGGIYVFEEGTKLSDGTTIQSMQKDGDPTMDYNMAHVMTSTIVANKAKQGGGIWYTQDLDANARFNSVAVWQNEAADQANVYGMVNPEQPTEDETLSEIFYPFSFSLIQNMRASGTNNLEAMGLNKQGVRFVNKNHDIGQGSNVDQLNIAEEKDESSLHAKLADFGFYGLTKYSTLCSNGMPKSYYEELQRRMALSDVDILGTKRIDEINNFIEIGARALPKRMPNKQLMLRLFVAHPDVVDTETATRFMRLNGTAGTPEGYYSQMGSSFAYPFNFMQDAIDYITRARNGQIDGLKLSDGSNATSEIVRNLPFEIVLGKGTYYPKQSLNGATESVWAQTFAIPEGVTIIGGFNPQGGGETYYGRYYKKGTISVDATGDIYKYVDPIPSSIATLGGTEVGRGNKYGEESVTLPAIEASAEHAAKDAKTITFQQWHIQDIADRRAMSDNNKNGIIEPWEFSNQTIISGNAVNGETDGVYHIMTAVSDADAVGLMPKAQQTNSAFVGSSIAEETGYQWKEQGQQIRLNGLIVTGGNALTYLSTALDEYGKYIFYQGAGLQVDGNRYNTSLGGTPVFHNSAAYGVGYRDIPVSITNCQFRNNKAGYGGAISTNGSLSIFASSFEQNLAIAQTETPEKGDDWFTMVSGEKQSVSKVMYPGQGGAILATRQLSAFNTLFANNEACLADGETPTINLVQHPTFRVPNKNNASATLRAAGGAIMMGSAAQHHIVNCDFVRNKANAYPAVFTMNPTVAQTPNAEGEVNTHDYSQIINTVAWGNEVNKISDDENYLRASKLMVNIGKKDRSTSYITTKTTEPTAFYSPAFTAENVPTAADLENTNAEATGNWQEAVWFCAYEDGVGFKPNNTNDLRTAIVYSPLKYAPTMIKEANNTYQNCNVEIVAENNDVAGPNFGNPSVKAGFDGFMEGADWSPARFNRLTDNGNGWIKQTVDNATLAVTFKNAKEEADTYQGAYPVTHYIDQFPEYKLWLALGNEPYMRATNDLEPNALTINGINVGQRHKNLPRISPDPTMGVEKAYIDIGVYEYQKQPLLKPGSEVDILWVSTKEHPENGPANGATWKTPTSDLQRAIETLLSSRNGHKKEIRIMEGEYAPVTLQTVGNGTNKYSAFVIDTKKLNAGAITPSTFTGTNNELYYAQSLTIKGGYSSDLMYEYDPVAYQTVIRQNEAKDGTNTDYLIYVADPTLRYAYNENGYTDANKQGAIGGNTGEAATAKVMPIQIDGVTLINGKATKDTKGSAIYYPNMTDITSAHSVSVGGQVVYYDSKEEMDKTDASGNHTGTTVDHETEFALITSEGENFIQSPAKIVIAKSHIIGSGNASDNAANASAVYIGNNGGSALIYNTVFHSNYGMPLDAYNTVNVNNTFGLNKGLVKLLDINEVSVKSQIHNSALWRNNNDGAQFSIPGVTIGEYGVTGNTTANFTYNSFTGGDTRYTDDANLVNNNHNTGLVNNNRDLANGPNFVDPENADVEARNFDITPSVRLLNRGMDTSLSLSTGNYYDLIVGQKYDYSLASTFNKDAAFRNRLNAPRIDIGAYEFQGNLYNILYVDPNKSHRDEATGLNWEDAFGYGDLQNAMDLAAIYHTTNPTKESYVFVKGASATNKGLTTNETLTIRNGVTVYGSITSSYTDWHETKAPNDPSKNKYASIEEYIEDMKNIREGVASNAASKTVVTGIKTSEYTVFDGGTNGTTPALVDGFVVTDPNEPQSPVLDLTNKSENAVIAVRNVIVADNDLSNAEGTNVNVAEVSNGLIYEVLMRDNKPKGTGAVLKVSNTLKNNTEGNYQTRGFAVNVTVEGKTVGADNYEPVDGMKSNTEATNNEAGAQIFKSITNSINSGSGSNKAGAVAPYGQITNKHISGYFYNIADANLNYQLTETSKYIDMCALDVDANGNPTFLPANLKKFVHYTTDRDILGNPRLISGVTNTDLIDRGAFETWKVENTGKVFECGDNGTIAANKYNTTYNNDAHALIKKHYYPHDGSVVYIMKNQSLVIDKVDPQHEVKPTPHNPGFMLVQEGANFYGNGRPATCAYLAIERKVKKTAGSIVSVPYAMQYNENVSKPKFVGGYLDELYSDVTSAAYDYTGKRSDWDYIFHGESSPCWEVIGTNDVTGANHGVLYLAKDGAFDGSDETVLLRFTGKGNGLADYIYTENGVSKEIVLTQHNNGGRDNTSAGGRAGNDPSGSGNGETISVGNNYVENGNSGDNADFTDNLDMGWNCFGIPYLVSDYKPYNTVTVNATNNSVVIDNTVNAEHPYQMQIPHTLWLYYDGVHTPDFDPETDDVDDKLVDGDGGFYSVGSWESSKDAWHVSSDAEKTLWVGEGFFAQTATLSTDRQETMTFYRPVYTEPSAGARERSLTRYYVSDGNGDIDGINQTTVADGEIIDTRYYTTDGVQIEKPLRHGVTIIRDIYSNGASKTRKSYK